MRIANAVLLLVVVLSTAAARAEVIRVVPLDVNDNAVFSCGDRCKFRGSLPNEALRVRIIRGTVSELAAAANDPRYVSAGCIELYSTVVRPRRSRRTSDLLDLKFYFNEGWLARGGANGEFVFVLERDNTPNGPAIERTAMLRLPAGPQGAAYFQAGVDVAVRAPVHVKRSDERGGFLARLFGATSSVTRTTKAKPTGGAETVAFTEMVSDAPLPEASPHAIATANCVDLQIDPQPVMFRRADVPPRARPAPATVADSRLRPR